MDIKSADSPSEECITLDNNLQQLNSLINEHFTVKMIKSCSFTGFVHAVDPISKSLLLAVPKGEDFQTVLIPGHAIISLSITTPLDSKRPIRKILATISEEEIELRREKVIAWLKKNLLPATIKDGAIDLAQKKKTSFTKLLLDGAVPGAIGQDEMNDSIAQNET